jgi:peptide/nickel transport system ATP-binding protein/oligopeptide transport system ATP-binding protein
VTPGALLEVDGLKAGYATGRGLFGQPKRHVTVIDGVSFDVQRGEALGLVGESGCGKTTLGRTLLGLHPASAGTVRLEGRSVLDMPPERAKAMRRQMQIVFQDPFASLDPRKTVGRSVRDGLDVHGIGSAGERPAVVLEMFRLVGLHPLHFDRYPHELSGGQRQRAGIARALILKPQFVVCDEPVSALDVSIQAQILNLLKDLQATLGITYLFISHNLGVIDHVSDRIAVMYFGRIVELAPRAALFSQPLHPYTRALLAAVPQAHATKRRVRVTPIGDPPDLARLPRGCRFRDRCPLASERCAIEEPVLAKAGDGHLVACWNYELGGQASP